MKQFVRLVGMAAFAFAANAFAQQFPTKAITLICPWSPGGGTDILGRLGLLVQ